MEIRKFKVSHRTKSGKNYSHQLQRQGKASGILYGKKKDPVKVEFDALELIKALDPARKRNTYFELEVEGIETSNVIIREIQMDSLTGRIKHVDFLRVNNNDKVLINVPFKIYGRSEGVRLGGKLRQVIRELPVKAQVDSIPASIEYDVTPLGAGAILRIGDINPPENSEIVMDKRQAVVIISSVGTKKEQTEEEAEEEAKA